MPYWACALIPLASAPFLAIGKMVWDAFVENRAAKAMGAVRAPPCLGSWPANADVIWKLKKRFETGYIGEFPETFLRV